MPSDHLDWMSDISPVSFVDDGLEIEKRMPDGSGIPSRPGWNVGKWVDSVYGSVNDPTPSTYTGSFVDDGADLLPRKASGPGFGKIDSKFYKTPTTTKGHEKKTEYPPAIQKAIQKAVSGDINRTMHKIRAVGEIKVVPAPDPAPAPVPATPEKPKEDKTTDTGAKETVSIWVPPKWGTFIIHGENGRVIVVDSDGEYDSGPQPPPTKRTGTKSKRPSADTEMDKAAAKLNPEAFFPPPPPKPVQARSPRTPKSKASKKQEKQGKPLVLPKPFLFPADIEAAWMSGSLNNGPSSAKLPTPTKEAKGEAGTWMSGALGGWPSPAKPEDSKKKDVDKTSTYRAPTVEDAPESPQKGSKYKNGYDEDNETYLNAEKGGIRYREGPKWDTAWRT